ncbi:DUF4198 domain-containing protein [Mucilaginibacter sp. UR6-1]|uniref:DUF4198 domain-containing protein n=1 Tax=Mucilaginibacter sp. UR6-1 TaxID=1435643 RepID=UPI001E4845ED|nr:DUF4198 domain-containing protein [Mucilaginibacter sp. UR6-1]MCC8408661.1 DUF4198 domain-containing protein [Mucilaginibacter sp. UR6-1]
MKRFYLLTAALFIAAVFTAATNEDFLLAENFFLHKGDKLSVRMFKANVTNTDDDYETPEAKDAKFALYEGSKKIPLTTVANDTVVTIKDYQVENGGLALLQLSQSATQEIDRETFLKHLEADGNEESVKKAKSFHTMNVREKYNRSIKTLVMVDKPSGNAYEKLVGDEFEIILKTNPYKMNYGDDVTAVVYFQNKPLESAPLKLYVKTPKGTIYPENLSSNAKGQVFFKLSREGIYMLRATRTDVAATGKDADFETWWTSYSFAFSSANELPNTYKEFGFGNKH